MNKLVVNSNHIYLNSGMYKVKYEVSDVTLTINGKVIIKDFNNKNMSIHIKLLDGAEVYYIKSNNSSKKDNIDIELNSNSKIEFNYSLKTTVESSIIFNSTVLGNNSISDIKFCGVTDKKGQIIAKATSDVPKDTLNNVASESIRIIALNDTENIVIPNLLVSTSNVSAIHNTAISGVPLDYLYYLNSKGIDNTLATKLIVDGFLKNNIKEK